MLCIWFPFGIPFNLFFTDLCRPISSWRAVQQHPQGLFRQGHHSPSTSYCCASAWAPWRTAHASPQHPPCSQGQGLGLGTGCTGTGYSWRPILVFFCVTHACANTPHNHTHRAPSSAFPPCVSAAFLAAGTAWLRARACSCFCLSCSSLPVVGGLEEVSPLSFQHLKQPLQLSTKGAHKKYLSLSHCMHVHWISSPKAPVS